MSKSNSEKPVELRKTLGLFEGITILIGITIGAGIYATPDKIADYQSSFAAIGTLWLVAGAFVFMGGLIHAELGTRLPHTGGEYVYISRAFGPFAGFIFGWAQLFIIRTSPAAGLAIVTVTYFEYFVPLGDPPDGNVTRMLLYILVIASIGLINYVGIKPASVFQNISTVIKVGGLFALVAVGLVLAQGSVAHLSETASPVSPQTDLGPFGMFGAAMMLIVFSYLGWDRVGYSAGEMKDPKRTIPLSIFWGIAIVVLVYLLANLLYHSVLGMEGVRNSGERVASATATKLFGPVGAGLVAIMVMISAMGSTNGTIMTAPRVYYAMARDKLFFNWFAFIHPKYRTPSRAILAHCAWATVILLLRANFENIVAGMVFAILIFYVVVTLALFKLRRDDVGGNDVFRVPLPIPLIFIAGLIALIGIRGYFEWQKSLVDLAFIATGLPFAFVFCRALAREKARGG